MTEPLHTSEDRLLDLIHRLLPAEEEKTVLAHLEECSPCEERFRILLHDHETARGEPVPVAGADGSIVGTRPHRRRWVRWMVPAVAAAVIIVAVWRVTSTRDTDETYWMPIQLNTSALRSADSVSVGSLEAFQAYEAHDASRTIELIRNSPPTDDEMVSSLQRLVLASALVNNGQPSEALTELETLEIFSLPVRWRHKAQWVEYLALRDAGRAEEARSRLEKLAEYEGDIGDRARAEIKR